MNEPRRFPYGGVPVYNPQSLSKGEALAQFHARQAAYQSLMDLLREERPSHVLIIGTRGMGKTTLLQRVHYGVEDDPELNSRYLVLAFPEEQYNVNRLHHFLLNTVDALADAMERARNERMLERVEAYAEMVGKLSQEEIEEQVPEFLAEVGQEMRRSLLLLVDNADRLFETIEDREQWRLRELLSNRRDLTLFGATTQASDGIYATDRAFFEFFKIHRLTPLTFAEVRELLLQLSESVEELEGEKGTAKRRVEEWLAADAARLRTLVQLTGGNPRTTVLLFHLVLDGLAGGAREYLEQLLDQCTPTYKGRVDELPAQAQQVLDAVALRWDPATAMEVAEDTGLETNIASTYLTRLVRQGLLEKADPGDSKKALYQVAERFFNIWYLMRASRRVRAKLRWFVEFLRVFFDSGELEQMAWERLEKFRSIGRSRAAEIETAFAYVLASGKERNRFEDYLRRECADIEPEWRPYLDLIRCSVDDDLAGKSIDGFAKTGPEVPVNSLDETEAAARKAIEAEPDNAENWRSLARVLIQRREFTGETEAAVRKATELDPNSPRDWATLGTLLMMTPERPQEAETAVRKAIELDPNSALPWAMLGNLLGQTPERKQEAEAALRKAIELDPKSAWSWSVLGDVLTGIPERREDVEAAYRKAIELDPKYALAWANLGNLLGRTPERSDEAEAAYRKAIELDPKHALAWANLGNLLGRTPERSDEAEAALGKAIELNQKFAGLWNDLGLLLATMPRRREEAESAYRRAIDLEPKFAGFWINLGLLLEQIPERWEEAEAAFREPTEFDPNNAHAWAHLGSLLERAPERREEAETALRNAIELDPKYAFPWANLGNLLGRTPELSDEAEVALRKAIDLAPKSAGLWNNLGLLLARMPGRREEAESAYRRAIDLEPKFAGFWIDLGLLLERIPERWEEAEVAFREPTEFDPNDAHAWAHLGSFLEQIPERREEAETALRKAIDLDPKESWVWSCLSDLLANTPERREEAESGFRKALEMDPRSGSLWGSFGVFLACRVGKPKEAEVALRKSVELEPDNSRNLRNLGVLLYCEVVEEKEAVHYLRRAWQLEPADPVSAAILAACARGSETGGEQTHIFIDASRQTSFWDELLELCQTYPPFGKILIGICDLVEERDSSNGLARLPRAVALAQVGDFPRASVALDDALVGDPIEVLRTGRRGLEMFFAAAVRNGRLRDCLELLDKKEWKDAWRPIYEALKSVEAGSGEYLKRVAVEIREPALQILRRIAPELPG